MRCAHFVCHACPEVSADRAQEEGYARGFADAVAKMKAETDAARAEGRAEERSAVIAWLTRLPIMSLRTRTMHYESRQIRDGRHVEKKGGV